jgi:outer membrane protein W
MTQRIYRILFLLFVVAGSVRLSAQTRSSDVGLWVVGTEWNVSFLGDQYLSREQRIGYGISFNHFWTDRFSTEISAQRSSTNATLRRYSFPDHQLVVNNGEVNSTAFTATALWHFNRAGRFSPYVGAGVTHLHNDFDTHNAGPGNSGYTETEMAPSAVAGVNVRLTDRVYLAGEVKTVPQLSYTEGSGGDFDVDPLSLSAGVKFRF